MNTTSHTSRILSLAFLLLLFLGCGGDGCCQDQIPFIIDGKASIESKIDEAIATGKPAVFPLGVYMVDSKISRVLNDETHLVIVGDSGTVFKLADGAVAGK